MYPRFLKIDVSGEYIKINSPEGDGLIISHLTESITASNKEYIRMLQSLSPEELIVFGGSQIDKEVFSEMYNAIMNRFVRQLIR